MESYLWVGIGGAIGSMARLAVATLTISRWGENFPWGTLIINVLGSFFIGFFFTLTGIGGRFPVSHLAKQFFMTGLCGGFTTFSAFSLQTLNLAQERDWFLAGFNVVASVILSLLAVWLGYLAALSLNSR